MAECSCHKCQQACHSTPGGFLPGEAEKAAEFLGKSLQDFFDESLGVDWDKGVFFLKPAITRMSAGQEYPFSNRGTCVFLKDGKCSIHAVKPFECREYVHTDTSGEIRDRGVKVMEAWAPHQDQIKELLDRYPYETEAEAWERWL